MAWCRSNYLQFNTTKTKEMVVNFRRLRFHLQPVSIEVVCVEMVRTYRYLGLELDDRLDWSSNTEGNGQSRLYFLRRLGSFNICQNLSQMLYQAVIASVLFYAVVCWGGSIKRRDATRLDKLVRKAGSVVGAELDTLTSVAEKRIIGKMLSILDNVLHPLHQCFSRQRSSFSDRLLSLACSTDSLSKSCVPRAIRLYNSSLWPGNELDCC